MLTAALALVLALAVAPILATAIACRTFIYHPTQLTKREVSDLAQKPGWERATLEAEKDVALVGLIRRPEGKDAATADWLLFFGGNAADLAGNQWALEQIRGRDDAPGLAVFAYRAYDGSGGRPSERALVDDAVRIAKWLEASCGAPASRLFVAGQSLGTGVATSLAAHFSKIGAPPRGLILISPYTSMAALFDEHVPIVPVGWAVRDAFFTKRRIADVASPILIVHGEEDVLIPPAHGRALKEAAGPKCRLVLLPGRGHNDVWADPKAANAIKGFLTDPGAAAGP